MDSSTGDMADKHEPGDKAIAAVERKKRLQSDALDQKQIERLDVLILDIMRKFRKRLEPSGYQSLPELWQDLLFALNESLALPAAQAAQRLLQLTSDFLDYCEAYRADTETEEYIEYFGIINEAWRTLLVRDGISTTDRIRALSLLKDGRERASCLNVPNVFETALQCALDTTYGAMESQTT